MSESVPLGCPDCGAKWPDQAGPMTALDGVKLDCPGCGRGYTLYVTITLNMVRR